MNRSIQRSVRKTIPFCIVLACLLFLSAPNCFASKVKLKAEIILNSNDTLKGHVVATIYSSYPNQLLEISFTAKMKLMDANEEITKIKYSEVKKLTIKDRDGETRVFVPVEGYKYKSLLEVLYSNKVRLYKWFYKGAMDGLQYESYELFNERGEKFRVSLMKSKKNVLQRFAKPYPEVSDYISDNKMTEENILKVLMMYESNLE